MGRTARARRDGGWVTRRVRRTIREEDISSHSFVARVRAFSSSSSSSSRARARGGVGAHLIANAAARIFLGYPRGGVDDDDDDVRRRDRDRA